MATLTVTVSTLTSTKTATNAHANTIIGNYIAAKSGPVAGTQQEQLDWFVDDITKYVREVHAAWVRQQAVEAASTTAYAEAEEWV